MKGPQLKQRLSQGRICCLPGIFDFISLKVADTLGFDALYMTGYGTVASHLGLPDAGLATYTDMVGRVQGFCAATATPIVCDGDTGYGGLLNVDHTVRGYEKAGAAAIQLEDQEFPKKCGHTPGRRVIAAEDMVAKVRVASQARSQSDSLLIIARTDARTSLGLDEALRRGERYLRAGADILFIESPETEQELETIGRTFAGVPLVVNNVEGGRTPILPPQQLQAMGFAMAIYPALGFLAAGHALREAYQSLQVRAAFQTTERMPELADFQAFSLMMGFQRVWDFDRQQAELAVQADRAQ